MVCTVGDLVDEDRTAPVLGLTGVTMTLGNRGCAAEKELALGGRAACGEAVN